MSLSTGFEDISISTSTITIPQNGSQSYTFTPSKKYGYSVISITMDGILTSIKLNGTPLTNAQATIQSDPNKQFRHTFKVPKLNNSAYTLTFYAQSSGQHVYNITIRGGVLSLIARQEKINSVIDRLDEVYQVYRNTKQGVSCIPAFPAKATKNKTKMSTSTYQQIKNTISTIWGYGTCNANQQTQTGTKINDESIEELRRKIDNKITTLCYTCDTYHVCDCHTSKYNETCGCYNSTYGYSQCYCNQACHNETCSCYAQTYTTYCHRYSCQCYMSNYGTCTCNGTTYNIPCSCNGQGYDANCNCYGGGSYVCYCDTASGYFIGQSCNCYSSSFWYCYSHSVCDQHIASDPCTSYYASCSCFLQAYNCTCNTGQYTISTCQPVSHSCGCNNTCNGYQNCSCNQTKYNYKCTCESKYNLQCYACYSQSNYCSSFNALTCGCDVSCNDYTYDPTDFTCGSFQVCNQFSTPCTTNTSTPACTTYNAGSTSSCVSAVYGTNNSKTSPSTSSYVSSCTCYSSNYSVCTVNEA